MTLPVFLVSASLIIQAAVNLFFEKEDVILIDGNGNRITGRTIKVSAPKARDFIFWNTSIGVKINNPKVNEVKIYLNITVSNVEPGRGIYPEAIIFYRNSSLLVDSNGKTISKAHSEKCALFLSDIKQGSNALLFTTNFALNAGQN